MEATTSSDSPAPPSAVRMAEAARADTATTGPAMPPASATTLQASPGRSRSRKSPNSVAANRQ